MTDYIQVITTLSQKEDAQAMAESLLEKRLAACVQIIGPITSMYWWEGEIDKASEYLCLVKSRKDRYPAIEKAIRKEHPYEVPEILVIPVSNGGKDYLAWLDQELQPE